MRYIIIGTGNIAGTYLNALKNSPNSEAVGFISRNWGNMLSPRSLLPSPGNMPNRLSLPVSRRVTIVRVIAVVGLWMVAGCLCNKPVITWIFLPGSLVGRARW